MFLVGAGPGDPDLLTVKAARVLGHCDVVLYDRLVSAEILRLVRPAAELIYVGKHEGEQDRVQPRIFDLLLRHALAGKIVVRLKGGDPLVFGRGAEEWALAREHGIDVELVPGVTSAVSAPGIAGIPLTHREISQSFAVITGHCKEGLAQNWADYARIDTLVILMGVEEPCLYRTVTHTCRPRSRRTRGVYRASYVGAAAGRDYDSPRNCERARRCRKPGGSCHRKRCARAGATRWHNGNGPGYLNAKDADTEPRA